MKRNYYSYLATGALACGLFLGMTGVTPAEVVRTEKGNLVMENVPEVPETISSRMQQYLSTRSATLCDWIPGEKGLFMYTRFGDTTQLHRIAAPGAYRQQLTFYSEPVSEAVVNPNKDRHSLIIVKDVGGNENYQLYYFDRDTSTTTMISDGKSRFESVLWSKDGERIVYQSNKRNGTDWDIWMADPLHPETAEIVYQGEGYWTPVAWSDDGRKLLIVHYVSIVDSSAHVLDLESGKLNRIGCEPNSKDVFSVEGAEFSRDGRKVYFTSDRGEQFHKLYVQDIASGKIRALAPEINWDAVSVKLSPDGRVLLFTVNEGGVSALYKLDLDKGTKAQRLTIPAGILTGLSFSEDGSQVALSVNGSRTPGDIFTLKLDDGSLERWTYSEVGGLDGDKFVEPKLISYPTFDKDNGKQRQIPAFVYMPRNIAEGTKVPVLINIHGGPESQFRPYFSSFTQYLVNEMGIAVISPNVRGSSGYGREYVQLDNGYLRLDSVKDIGALLDWIKDQPDLDADHVAVMGGSYGGYMTLASLCMFNDRLAAGVDNVGISNFVTFLKNTKDYRRDLRRAEYGDERDPKMYKFLNDTAPSNNASKITKPLYVVQGANDPRVPLSEAEQIVAKVRENGGDVWYMVGKDEGHGFRKKVNRDHYLETVVLFLQKHLQGK